MDFQHSEEFLTRYDAAVDEFRVSGALPLLSITSYLVFCLLLGPAYMKSRQPFKLKKLILLYDVVLVLANLYIVLAMAPYILTPNWDYHCPKDTKKMLLILIKEQGHYIRCMYILKYLELFDTVFFVLTKKSDHVSFLHIAHHTTVPIVLWYGLNYEPTDATYGTAIMVLNTFVHVLMYGYYALTALGFNLRWKRHLTSMQIVQFIMQMIFLLVLLSFGCIRVTPSVCFVGVFLPGIAFLFIKFYKKTFQIQR